MIGELTYRCPLRCTYCANPVQLSAYAQELATQEWLALLRQARALGVLQLHLSGGEPLLHRDLPVLIAEATRLGIYTNLVTSGVPLTGQRLAALVDAGLDHIQLSLQDADATSADAIAGVRVHQRKLVAARQIKETGLPMTINVVLHAGNLDRLAAIGELALELGADRLELAHTQFYGWAWRNRAALLPTEQQIDAAALAADALKDRVGDAVEIVHVRPDYHLGTPKPCMHGWGSRQFAVAPNGDVLPCLAAAQLPDMDIPNVRRQPLAGIWRNSAAFTRFRGTAWLPEPCQSCALRDVDFGGCRCQAYQLTGDATATDPVCHLSPSHSEVTALVAAAAPGMPRPVAVARRWR